LAGFYRHSPADTLWKQSLLCFTMGFLTLAVPMMFGWLRKKSRCCEPPEHHRIDSAKSFRASLRSWRAAWWRKAPRDPESRRMSHELEDLPTGLENPSAAHHLDQEVFPPSPSRTEGKGL
jgi:hypothetical protein